jgi:hypothetical protein
MKRITRSLMAISLVLAALPIAAITYQVPDDRTLIANAEAIVEATVLATESRERANGRIYTEVTLSVQRTLKGEVRSEEITFTHPGGALPDRWMIIPGAPMYRMGDRILLFLSSNNFGERTSYGLGLGSFFSTLDGEERVLTRGVGESEIHGWDAQGAPHVERPRKAEAFTSFIEQELAAPGRARADYWIELSGDSHHSLSEETPQNFAPSNYLLQFQPGKYTRWPTASTPSPLSVTFVTARQQTGASDSAGTAATALQAWASGGSPNLSLSIAGQDEAFAVPFTDDNKNSIVFNTTTAELSAVGGGHEQGWTQLYGSGASHPFNGELNTYFDITEADIFIKNTIPGSNHNLFLEALTHEAGHALGFRHSNEGTPSSASAVMRSVIDGFLGANLQSWDLDAVQTVYGSGPTCAEPVITQQPQPASIFTNQTATLSVSVSGSAPFAYQWHRVDGNNVTAIPGANGASYTTPPMTQSAQFYVKVTNSCGNAESQRATVTVVECTAPYAVVQPADQTIVSGSTATLSAEFEGTAPLSFQWFDATSGNTLIPGATQRSFTTPVLTADRRYLVQVSNECATVVSRVALVTVTASCTEPAITSQPASQTITSGQTATLTVGASGTSLTYQWLRNGTVIPGATSSSYTTPPMTANANFSVRVVNSCGEVMSAVATITVTGGCQIPAIQAQPASQSIAHGATATLQVSVSGTEPFTYQWYRGNSPDLTTPVSGATFPSLTTTAITSPTSFWVRVSNECGSTNSATATITPICTAPSAPEPGVAGQVLSGQSYTVSWEAVPGAGAYDIQESTSPDFAGATTRNLSGTSTQYVHHLTTPARYYYRVRGIASCDGRVGPFSATASVAIVLPPSGNDIDPNISIPVGSTQQVQFVYRLAPPVMAAGTAFTATVDREWLSVTPSSGVVPANGIDLTVSADPSAKTVGTYSGTLVITPAAGKIAAQSGGSVSTTFSVSMVTPIKPAPKPGASGGAAMIPVVGHASGANNSKFLSDVRISNVGSQKVKYDLIFTPTRTNAAASSQTTMEVSPGETIAMNDVVKNWFGLGSLGESAVGVLEIRPHAVPGFDISRWTIASSRTYNNTSEGTFGQLIPAIALDRFISRPASGAAPKISLQQISQSTAYRTNFGIVEGAGEHATALVRIYNAAGQQVATTTINLQPGEHQQINGLLQMLNVAIEDGRIEVEVTSATGKVTAYASVVDNRTNDPLLVSPTVVNQTSERNWFIPGVADLTNAAASWRSDVRIFNPSGTTSNVTLTFYPQGNPGGAVSKPLSIPPGRVIALDGILQSFFEVNNAGGMLRVFSATPQPLVVTARTYDQKPVGTYGQFIPGISVLDAVGTGERSLQLLQVEESARFRSNLGLAELSGQPATVEITAIVPSSRVTPVMHVQLQPFQFTQINQVLRQMNLSTEYNVRLQLRVVAGAGKVGGYVSVVDNLTQDPTYVPAQ